MNQSCTNHEYFVKLHVQFIKVLEIMNSTSQGWFSPPQACDDFVIVNVSMVVYMFCACVGFDFGNVLFVYL
jgi:hypothetical protein